MMSELKSVLADEITSYECQCPNCKETICSDTHSDWDIGQNLHSTLEIECYHCNNHFDVDIP